VSDEARTRRRPAVSDDAKLQRRDEIMAAAKKVFARSGFHATTIADIAKEADLAYGSVYQYFDSKDDLFHTLMSAEGYALRTHVAVALAATGERSDKSWAPLRAAVQATFEFFEKDKATAKLLLRDPYALGDRFEKHLSSIYERFIDDIESHMVAVQERGGDQRPTSDGGLQPGGADRAAGPPAADHRRRRHRSRSRRLHRLAGPQRVATGLEPARVTNS
jgi:AcrR family transcriptional regulator